jgi:hypothetical protein
MCVITLFRRRGQLKCDGTRAEMGFSFSAKRTSPLKSAGASVQSTTGSRGVRISGSNPGYTVFRGSVKGTGYPLHSPVSPSLSRPCVTACHHISTTVQNSFYSTAYVSPHALITPTFWRCPWLQCTKQRQLLRMSKVQLRGADWDGLLRNDLRSSRYA